MYSSLDVIDNYLSIREENDFSTIPGSDIEQFGERVREFAASPTTLLNERRHPVYLGGWPSANFSLLHGDLILSSLLYSGQVLVRDPILDWFSTEQYYVEHMMSARAGYRMPDEDAENSIRRTRAFLSTAVPSLERMRPLIEAGIVVPVSSEPTYFHQRDDIDKLRQAVHARIQMDPTEYSDRFGAVEIATEDNVRGHFVMAPGPDPKPQIQQAVKHGIRYFAREYTLASVHGATYTAPFAHEHFLCAEGISPLVGPSTRVVEAVLRSGLPVFQGLSPKLIRDIHDDDAFGEFRSTLHEVYQNTPIEDPAQAQLYIRDQESALLDPLVAQGERSASSGFLARAGAVLTGNRYSMAAALTADLTLGTQGLSTAINVAGTVLDDLVRARSSTKGPQRIWSALVAHNRSAVDEIREVQATAAKDNGPNWGVSAEEGMSVTVTAGQVIWDGHLNTVQLPELDAAQQERLGVYRVCMCGSGRKYRFCCYKVR